MSRRKNRDADIKTLRGLWDKRDIPHIPAAELSRITDEDVADLVRFWWTKDHRWDDEEAPAYRSNRDVKPEEASAPPQHRCVHRPQYTGQALAPRQKIGIAKISRES